MYISDNPYLWWRRNYAKVEKGACKIETWDQFKRVLNLENVVYEARKKLKELKHDNL